MPLIRTLLALSMLGMAISAYAAESRTGYPDLYQTPIVTSDLKTCPVVDGLGQKTMVDKNGNALITVCARAAEQCAFFGSCIIQQPGQKDIGYNFISYNEEMFVTSFAEIDMSICPYGYGYGRKANGQGTQTCLDPYFSVAASRTEHRVGEVLFVPMLKDRLLPTGETHDGFVIVRDSSRLLEDAPYDRYTFFVGISGASHFIDGLFKKQLINTDHTFDYSVVTGAKAQAVREKRNFPGLNAAAKSAAQRGQK